MDSGGRLLLPEILVQNDLPPPPSLQKRDFQSTFACSSLAVTPSEKVYH